jgi:ElaB/YqjD/DUF883 family membrane-anchored ribosome-binding protein
MSIEIKGSSIMPDKNHNHIDDRLEKLADDAARGVGEFGREARKRTEDLKNDLAGQLFQAASTLRKEARAAKAGDDAIRTADKMSKNLEKAGTYLRRHSLDDMGDEATRAVRRNPWRIVLIALAIGVILGVLLRGDDKQYSNGVYRPTDYDRYR